MPELMATLIASREKQHEHHKFLAAIQGIDLDEGQNNGKQKGQKEWEDLKARVFSRGQAVDSDDITSLQGPNALNAGFGIGNGLEYSDLKNQEPKNPFA